MLAAAAGSKQNHIMLRGLVLRGLSICATRGSAFGPQVILKRGSRNIHVKPAAPVSCHFFCASTIAASNGGLRRMSTAVHDSGTSNSGAGNSVDMDVNASSSDVQVSETMRRILSLDNASQEEKHRYRMRQVLKEYQLHPSDTGSSEVQIALMTERMAHLAEHVKQHRKDHNTKRGLIQIVSDRRALLKYLKREDEERYQRLIARLGIRDVISLMPARCFLPAKAALAAAAKTRQRSQVRTQAVKKASADRARGEVAAQRRAGEQVRRAAADEKYKAKRAAAAAAAGGGGADEAKE